MDKWEWKVFLPGCKTIRTIEYFHLKRTKEETSTNSECSKVNCCHQHCSAREDILTRLTRSISFDVFFLGRFLSDCHAIHTHTPSPAHHTIRFVLQRWHAYVLPQTARNRSIRTWLVFAHIQSMCQLKWKKEDGKNNGEHGTQKPVHKHIE